MSMCKTSIAKVRRNMKQLEKVCNSLSNLTDLPMGIVEYNTILRAHRLIDEARTLLASIPIK